MSRLRQLWRLAVRNAVRQKGRTAMTLAAVVFGVVAMILTGGFIEDTIIELGESLIHSQSGHLQVSRAGYFQRGYTAPEKFLLTEPEPVVTSISRLREVEDVLQRITFSGLINNGRTDYAVVGEGVEPDKEARLGTYMTIASGRQLAGQDRFSVLLGNGVARALGLRIGDRVTLVVSAQGGAMNALDFDVVGTFQTFMKEFDDRAVRIPLLAAKELLGTRGTNAIVVALKQTKDTHRTYNRLIESLDPNTYEVKTWIDLNDFYENTVAFYTRLFALLKLIILVMIVLGVSNSVALNITERLGEFGTMMALGNERRDVFRMLLLENLLLGLFGALLGAGAGVGLATVISHVGIPMPPPPNSELGYISRILVVPSVVATAMVIGCLATVLAAIGPARRVSRTPVGDALRSAI